MIRTYDAGTVNDVYPRLVQDLRGAPVVNSRNGYTREFHPCYLDIVDPVNCYVTSYGRMINLPFALIEVLWILSGDNSVERPHFYNSNIKNYSDNGITFNAAYGYRMRKHFSGVDQLHDVIEKLEADLSGRQAVLTTFDPMFDRASKDTKDRACNVISMFLYRDGALDLSQVIRSNDVSWGLPYNFIQWCSLLQFIADYLKVPVGHYYHLANSLHLYDIHEEEAATVQPFNLMDFVGQIEIELPNPGNWIDTDDFINMVAQYEGGIRKGQLHGTALDNLLNDTKQLPYYWREMLKVFVSYRYWKQDKQESEAFKYAASLEDGPFFPMLMKNYWHWRIKKLDSDDRRIGMFMDTIQTWLMNIVGSPGQVEEVRKWIYEESKVVAK